MLKLDDGTLVLAATDLTNHLACPHLTQQRLAIARGERGKPRPADDPHADLIRSRGEEHERNVLIQLTAGQDGWVDLSSDAGLHTRAELERAAAEAAEAMRAGASLIYQPVLFDGRWQGRADFLRRVPIASNLGAWSYEVLDTKLARHAKPEYAHQLSIYSKLVGLVQGREPDVAHLLLGDDTTLTIELRRYAALHRYVVVQLERIVDAPACDTYPEPVGHCDICALSAECDAMRRADDHLSLVAGARRDHREQLVEIGLGTVQALAEASESTDARPIRAERFQLLHHQAALQVESRDTHQPVHRHLDPARATGYALLPPPSAGDVFFDLEGDPYVGEVGIEYLWGWCSADGTYDCAWAHDAKREKAALEQFVDVVIERRRNHPDMHVFHYAPHERSKLRSLAIQYGTRELEVDELLRNEVLVDLYAIVRQGMQIGEESYSLKKLERHHGFVRHERRVREGGGSIVAYETWLETGDSELLEAIRAYNAEDCDSARALRDWLVAQIVPEAESKFGVDFADLREPEPEEAPQAPKWLPEVLDLVGRLTAGLQATGEHDTPAEAERRLLAQLLLYHYRENKPAWWRFFDLRGTPVEELIDDRDAIAGLARDESVSPTPVSNSLDYRFTFPPQEFRLEPGNALDPTTGESCKLVAVAEDHVLLRRGRNRPPPSPVALIAGEPINPAPLRNALIELAESVLADDGRAVAARRLLRREPPRLASGRLGETEDELIGATLGLDRSVLSIQGPPGTGKTHNGARMILAALSAGMRVGVTAFSHAAIHNLLHAVEKHAHEEGQVFCGIYKKGPDYISPPGFVTETADNAKVTDDYQLVAGTAWLFARPEHRSKFGVVFVDEAGQFALADAVAVALATDNLVLLGDPQQLPQVTQASHPDGAGASALEHVLDGAQTIRPDLGVLLTESWRMHPDVCSFVSERSYDRKLRSRDECERRRVDATAGSITGAGLRALAIEHEGRSQESPEEADAIAAVCRELLAGSTVTDEHGTTRSLVGTDMMVLAPYNMAVHRIRERVPLGVRVGTVDRFQGQQAAVVFYAMTCSSGEDAPRGIDFLFDKNRLNVAISRAQCFAVLVYNPRLLDADCRTLDAMQSVDGICRFVELARRITI
jgi:uncharacterized protein